MTIQPHLALYGDPNLHAEDSNTPSIYKSVLQSDLILGIGADHESMIAGLVLAVLLQTSKLGFWQAAACLTSRLPALFCMLQETAPLNLDGLQRLCSALTTAAQQEAEDPMSASEYLKVGQLGCMAQPAKFLLFRSGVSLKHHPCCLAANKAANTVCMAG